LIVSGGRNSAGFVTRHIDDHALGELTIPRHSIKEGKPKEWVGCGRALGDGLIAIVDPDTRTRVPVLDVGEVWVSSRSVTRGYWNQAEETQHSFVSSIYGEKGTFLRTGDLGFMDENGELYITGRLNDLIIVDGRNVYPQDLERAAEQSHPAVRQGCTAA